MARGWNGTSNYFDFLFNDNSGACWVGQNIREYTNGDWHFPNQYNDTLLIKTTAQTGDSWTLYSDTTAVWFEAQVTAPDTQTVRGNLDSVKIITITTKVGSNTQTNHPLNGWRIILSKENGFAQLPDCFSFPYRDFTFFNNLVNPWYLFLNPNNLTPTKNDLLFRAVPNLYPVGARIYDFNPGDAFHYDTIYYYNGRVLGLNDTILTRQQTVSVLHYTVREWLLVLSQNSVLYSSLRDVYVRAGFLVDTLLMPEEYSTHTPYTRVYVYSASATGGNTHCGITSDTVWEVCRHGGGGLMLLGNNIAAHSYYRQGLGLTYYNFSSVGEGQGWNKNLKFFSKNGSSCGYPTDIVKMLGIGETAETSFKIYPQPATTEVYLEALSLRYPATIRIQNLQGQLLSTQELLSAGKPISTANLPAGLYLLSVTDAGGNSGAQKLLIEH